MYRQFRNLFFLFVGSFSFQAWAASPSTVAVIGGISWNVPKSYISGQSTSGLGHNSLSLQFALPSLLPADFTKFSDVYPNDDKPILSVTISDDPHVVVGQMLLGQLMTRAAAVSCSYGVGDSFLGGTKYSNHALSRSVGPCTNPDVPFDLYVIQTSKGTWFSVCYFKPYGAPLPCEVREQYGKATITYKFPDEYLSEAIKIGAQMRIKLASFQSPPASPEPDDLEMALPKPPCWAPPPGSPGSKLIPLKIGPEVWHIPQAFGETFGSNQTQDPQIDGFQIWLKLPDLEPITSNDPSPFETRGSRNYIALSFNFDNRPWKIPKGPMNLNQILYLSKYIGQNPFINYKEYWQYGSSPTNFKYRYKEGIIFVSNDPSSNIYSFPPVYFDCDAADSAPNPLCTFRLVGHPKTSAPGLVVPGVYDIEYWFSRDYFSQLDAINACVQTLYDEFRYGKRN